MPTSKNAHEDPMRELESIVKESFETQIIACGFIWLRRGWRSWRDAVAVWTKENAESRHSNAVIESRAEDIRRQSLVNQNVEALARACLVADGDIWDANLSYARNMVGDSVGNCPPYPEDFMLKKAIWMRTEYGATSVLEELLVEWAILAWLEHQRLAAFAELFKEELAPPKKLIRQVRSAELRAQRAARMCAAARQLRTTENESTQQGHGECPSSAPAMPVMDPVPSGSSIKDLPLS